MSWSENEYALFPLQSVLFPGGSLSLRIFEPRYLDMVRDCTRLGRPFGVCLLIKPQQPGEQASAVAVGTLARIVDFYTLPDGLLGIRCEGERRFRVEQAHVRHDGLIVGRLRLWEHESSHQLPPEYGLLATLAASLIENLGQGEREPDQALFDDASWVGFRLAEMLPFGLSERQQLLEMTDPCTRLQRILDILPRFRSDDDDEDEDGNGEEGGGGPGGHA